jgi:hypothetical protein
LLLPLLLPLLFRCHPGYDASGKMAEESRNAAKVAPFGIFMTVLISGDCQQLAQQQSAVISSPTRR